MADPNLFLRIHASSNFSPFCLSYLLTAHDFGGTLGVAYVGGVCARYGRVKDEKTGRVAMLSTNSGFISVEDPGPSGIPEAQHSMAHEIGNL